MKRLLRKRWPLAGMLLAGSVLAAEALAAVPARPGMINYLEGQVSIDDRPVATQSIGTAEVSANGVLRTENGKAEMLLTPGVFVRVGDHSALRLVSPQLTQTKIELLQGEVLVEVTDLHKQNEIDVLDHGTSTQLEKNGLYRFNADEVAVLDGRADVTGDDGQKRVWLLWNDGPAGGV